MARSNDEKLMRLALKEGRKGLGLTSPNPPVGAIIVSIENEILGRGWHRGAGLPHAEIEAFSDARDRGYDVTGATIYVTLEPCSTHGRTPPCCDAIIRAGIRRVVIGTLDPNPDHAGAAVQILERKGIEVLVGVCEAASQSLIRFFGKHITTGRPWVMAKSAITLDGRTTLAEGAGQWISGKRSRADVHRLRSQVDAILIGGETLRRDNPRLTIRDRRIARGKQQPWRVILSAQAKVDEGLHVFSDEFAERTVLRVGEGLEDSLDYLGGKGISSVMIESGGRLFAHGLEEGLIDEVIIYVAPILGGGSTRLLPLDEMMTRLDEVEVKRMGLDLRISGRPVKLAV